MPPKMLHGGGFSKSFYCEKFQTYTKVDQYCELHEPKLIPNNDQLSQLASSLYFYFSPSLQTFFLEVNLNYQINEFRATLVLLMKLRVI